MNRFVFSFLLLLAAPVFAQELILFPPAYPGPTDGTNVVSTSTTRSSVRLTLDAAGGPVVSCWKGAGLMGKVCELIPSLVPVNAGFSCFRPNLASDFHDLQAMAIYHTVMLPSPDWTIQLGCVTNIENQGGGLRLITITDGLDSAEVRCWTNLGGLLEDVCAVLEEGDCGTFQGNDGSPNGTIFQVIAWKGLVGL